MRRSGKQTLAVFTGYREDGGVEYADFEFEEGGALYTKSVAKEFWEEYVKPGPGSSILCIE